MSTEKGKPLQPESFSKQIWKGNLRNLATWMSVGADMENGKYAMMGARLGCYNTVLAGKDHIGVRDLENMENIFTSFNTTNDIDKELLVYGESIRQRLDIPIADYDENQSKFFKYAMDAQLNRGVQDRESK